MGANRRRICSRCGARRLAAAQLVHCHRNPEYQQGLRSVTDIARTTAHEGLHGTNAGRELYDFAKGLQLNQKEWDDIHQKTFKDAAKDLIP